MPLHIIKGDITSLRVDAIVNAANTALQAGGGVCGAIFRSAGASELQKACNRLAPIKTGEAVLTPAFALPCKYIIHTAGPIYKDGVSGEPQLLHLCYTNSFNCALASHCTSIAFPAISTGIYGYPIKQALQIATSAIKQFLTQNDLDVFLVLFDNNVFEIAKTLQ